jgi:nucleoside-diphosphate kinase
MLRRRAALHLCRRHCSAAAAPPPSPCTHEGTPSQRTLLALKPDTVQRGLVGALLARFEQRGFKVVGLKMLQPTRELAERHYEEHRGKHFYERACCFLTSGPVVAAVLEGREVISATRAMIGATEPLESAPGTIRFDYGAHWRRNLVHGSDSDEAAAREIELWFRPEELVGWEHSAAPWVYELPSARTRFDE